MLPFNNILGKIFFSWNFNIVATGGVQANLELLGFLIYLFIFKERET